MRPAYVVIGVLVLALVGAGVYVATNPDVLDTFKTKKSITNDKQIQKMAVGFVANPYQDDYGMIRVSGYVDNKSKSKIVTAKLEINLLDEKGNRKERIEYQLSGIDANSRKSFDTIGGTYAGPRNAQMKIAAIEVVQ